MPSVTAGASKRLKRSTVKMAQVVPAVTATNKEQYQQLISKLEFAPRLHLDFMDGQFTDVQSLNLVEAWWPETTSVDLHLMYQNPASQLETAISRNPQLVIIPAEAAGDLPSLIRQLQQLGIKAGVALLPETAVAATTDLIKLSDHTLIFSGHLGHYGGQFQPALLGKAAEIKAIKPEIEIGWDGGVDNLNIAQVAAAGVEVINSGGFISQNPEPKVAYDQLLAALDKADDS